MTLAIFLSTTGRCSLDNESACLIDLRLFSLLATITAIACAALCLSHLAQGLYFGWVWKLGKKSYRKDAPGFYYSGIAFWVVMIGMSVIFSAAMFDGLIEALNRKPIW